MKYIITEEQSLKLRLVRRLEDIDDSIPFKMVEMTNLYHICKQTPEIFMDSVIGEITHDLYYAHFSDIDDNSKEWKMIYDMMVNYIESKFTDRMLNFYEHHCGQETLTESKSHFLRRLPEINKLIVTSLEMFSDWDNPRVDVDHLVKFLSYDVTEQYFFRNYEDIDVGGDDYDELHDFVESYLNSNWRDKIGSILKIRKNK